MDMVDEITLLIALGTLNLLALVALWYWIQDSISKLDHSLALALQNSLQNLPQTLMENFGDGISAFEPPNVIQQAIAQLIQSVATQKMNTVEASVTSRGADGTFSKLE